MENFEMIESYVLDKLEGQEKTAFEKQLQSNSALQHEVEFQKDLIEGIKSARAAQLKTRLSQVQVTTVSQFNSSIKYFTAGAITSAIVISGLFYYFKPFQNTPIVSEVKNKKPLVENGSATDSSLVETEETKPEIKNEVVEAKKKASNKISSDKNEQPHPTIQVTDPTDELTNSQANQMNVELKEQDKITIAHIKVETNDSNSNYAFHYQFDQNHLILYGKFDNGLYEIIEVNGSAHSMFLYYKDYFYLLDEKQTAITPLTPINDLQLIKKLKEYRKD